MGDDQDHMDIYIENRYLQENDDLLLKSKKRSHKDVQSKEELMLLSKSLMPESLFHKFDS